jgi:pimeloyl-ACP methyl ester carboxylesterase
MPLITANGAELYHELRGDGPRVLLIIGAPGDSGPFEPFATLLADEFTVITYDRRGNGRSPRPPGWDTTSPEEQAADAAGLLDALGLAPAAVFGTSSAGIFALALLIGHPASVRGAVLHEPALFSLFDDPHEVRETLTALIKEGMESGGQPAALERFIRFVAGDANWERLDPSVRERIRASAGTYLGVESSSFDTYLPDDQTLAGIAAPIQLLVSDSSLPAFSEAAGRLAKRLGVEVMRTDGTHFPYLDHPRELAETVRPFLRQISD